MAAEAVTAMAPQTAIVQDVLRILTSMQVSSIRRRLDQVGSQSTGLKHTHEPGDRPTSRGRIRATM